MTFSFSIFFLFPTDDSVGNMHFKSEESARFYFWWRGGGGGRRDFSKRPINKLMIHLGTREFPLD